MEDNIQPQKPTVVIWETISEGWKLVAGGKWPMWAIMVLGAVASFVIQMLMAFIFRFDPQNPPVFYHYFLIPCISSIVVAPFYAGAVMVGIKRARGEVVTPSTGYQYFNKTISLMVTMLIIAFLANVAMYIMHLPAVVAGVGSQIVWLSLLASIISILVYVFLFFSIPLVTDKNLTPWQALKASFNTIKRAWFRVLVLLVIMYLFFLIAMIPFLVGALIHPYARMLGIAVLVLALIWLIPLAFYTQGVLYRKLVD